MNNKKLFLRGLIHALALTAYVALVAFLMQNANNIFGKVEGMFAPMAFLLLFVFSALITGSLILVKPAMLYLDGNKKEALKLFLYTSASLFVILLISLAALIIIR